MIHPSGVVLFLLGAVSFLTATAKAQVGLMSDSSARTLRELRRTIERDRRSADSLRGMWDRQWRLSDSLRVESMLFRMRSDSLRRAVASAERCELEILQNLARSTNDGQSDTIRSNAGLASPPVRSNTAELAAVEMARKGRPSDSVDDAELIERTLRTNRKSRPVTGRTLSDTLTERVMQAEPDTGVASYYADAFHGRRTSSGEVFDMHDRTCAHRWLPFNTRLLVTNLSNGREVVVRVTDRGPWKKTRIIDLSKQAAIDLDMIRAGTARVSIRVYNDQPDPMRSDSTGTR